MARKASVQCGAASLSTMLPSAAKRLRLNIFMATSSAGDRRSLGEPPLPICA
jgi:hypothetical protein